MLNNKYPIFYRQWKDYFDFLEISILLPEITFKSVGISTRLKNEAFSNGDRTPFSLSFETRISLESSLTSKVFRFVIFGFGFEATRMTGY